MKSGELAALGDDGSYTQQDRPGKINVSRIRWFHRRTEERDEYVSKEEFAGLFDSEQVALQQLALLLTSNLAAVSQCLGLALQQCLTSSSVFKGRGFASARRMVIRNAIDLVMGPGGQPLVDMSSGAHHEQVALSPDYYLGAVAASESILGLPAFERLVFVICVLEGYSIRDCALLLRRSPLDISEARERVVNQIEHIDQCNDCSEHFATR